jgi:LmbE family N-acetylglucosaminyl deacetylase
LLARRVPLLIFTSIFSLAAWSQTNTAAGAGTYPAQPQPNSTANLGVRPEVLPWDTGEAGLHLLAKKLKNTGRIMHLTAHPDDEDGALLTYLARGQGRQVLLMSLTRGEGGQNRTGSNLWDELGVLRTLELLESTRYYGTELRFSRVADFGFSKSADETFQKWGGHQVPLRDIVYVIREWKPDVLFTRFSGTPRDGHGMHQASAILAPEAVKCAADPNCFPDQLKGDHALTTWQVLKLYMGNQGGDYTVRYDVSQIDPDTKLSYTQMALEGFKHQASQLSGNFTPPSGPNWRSYKLISTSIPNYKADKEQDFFEGIDTTLAGLANREPDNSEKKLAQKISSKQALLNEALQEMSASKFLQFANQVQGSVVGWTDAYGKPNQIAPKPSFIRSRSSAKLMQAHREAELLLGLSVGSLADRSTYSPGDVFEAMIGVQNRGAEKIGLTGMFIAQTNAFRAAQPTLLPIDSSTISPNGSKRAKQRIQIPTDAPVSRPPWSRDSEQDNSYRNVGHYPGSITHPFSPSPFAATAFYQLNNARGSLNAPLETSDGRDIAILPPVSLLFQHNSIVISEQQSIFKCAVTSRPLHPIKQATLRVKVPSGWTVEPASVPISLGDTQIDQSFTVTVPKGAKGQFQVGAELIAGKATYSEGYSRVTREDLGSAYYFQPAAERVSIVDVNVPKNLRVGYIPGAGDDIFPVLQQLGLNAKQISNDELAKGDLHQYDTIVVGIRGYDERPEIRANNQRLLDFVNDGGTLVVQNQKAEDVFNSGHFTPYAATLGRERVSVEEAPVTVLAPNDSVFNSPNKITPADFDGWVQERGINFMSNWDQKFEPLLASNDPGEQPLKGGLLRAKYGKGTYIYTGYAFFRQLPAGVPGAVRLYVNLLNAGHVAK